MFLSSFDSEKTHWARTLQHTQTGEGRGRKTSKTNTSQWLCFILPFDLRTQILAEIENVPTQLLTKKITLAQFIVCFKSRIGIITFPLPSQWDVCILYFIMYYLVKQIEISVELFDIIHNLCYVCYIIAVVNFNIFNDTILHNRKSLHLQFTSIFVINTILNTIQILSIQIFTINGYLTVKNLNSQITIYCKYS